MICGQKRMLRSSTGLVAIVGVKSQRAIEYVSSKLGGNPYAVTPK